MCLCSHNTKVEFSGHNSERDVWLKNKTVYHPETTIPMLMHGGGSIVLWGFSSAETRTLIKTESIVDSPKYQSIFSTEPAGLG